jgi:hypothetical protein
MRSSQDASSPFRAPIPDSPSLFFPHPTPPPSQNTSDTISGPFGDGVPVREISSLLGHDKAFGAVPFSNERLD